MIVANISRHWTQLCEFVNFPSVFPDSVAKLSGLDAAAEETERTYDFDGIASSAIKTIAVCESEQK